jgi:hypothetical protein
MPVYILFGTHAFALVSSRILAIARRANEKHSPIWLKKEGKVGRKATLLLFPFCVRRTWTDSPGIVA